MSSNENEVTNNTTNYTSPHESHIFSHHTNHQATTQNVNETHLHAASNVIQNATQQNSTNFNAANLQTYTNMIISINTNINTTNYTSPNIPHLISHHIIQRDQIQNATAANFQTTLNTTQQATINTVQNITSVNTEYIMPQRLMQQNSTAQNLTIRNIQAKSNATQNTTQHNQEHIIPRRLTSQQNNTTTSTAKALNVLEVKSIYYLTLINEFYKDRRFLNTIDHVHNTRSRAQGKYKVQQFQNEYGRSTLGVALPTIFNKIPNSIRNENNIFKRKKQLKKYFISSQ